MRKKINKELKEETKQKNFARTGKNCFFRVSKRQQDKEIVHKQQILERKK